VNSHWQSDAINTQSRNDRPRPVALLVISGLVGLAIGLYYAWIINPVSYVEATPAHLSAAHRAEFVQLIARTYTVEPDLALAESRLAALGRPDTQQAVLETLETGIREGRPAADIHALAGLARAMGAEAPAVALFAPPSSPAATLTINPELAPLPLQASVADTLPPLSSDAPTSPTRAAPAGSPSRFQLLNREQLCPPENEGGRIELLIVNAAGTPQPGEAIIVTWPAGQAPGGSDRFLTGYKEGGYGDFLMQPDVTYTVVLPDGRTAEGDLRLETCADGQTGDWRLTFQKDEG
jgi:hypothetical protein